MAKSFPPSSFSSSSFSLCSSSESDFFLENFLKQAFFLSLDFDSILCAWGEAKRGKALSDFSEDEKGPFFFLSDFFLEEEKPWWSFKKTALLPKAHFEELLKSFKRSKFQEERVSRTWLQPSKEKFFSQAEKVDHFLQEEKLKKVVLLGAEVSQGSPSSLEKCSLLLSSFKHQRKGTSIYGFWKESKGLIGITPEGLFDWSKKQKSLFSMALAGTLTHTSKNSLLHQKKDLEEHEMVVQDLTQKLSQVVHGEGKLWKSKTYEWKVEFLKHLRTDFFVKNLSSLSEEKLIDLLHPTPALGLISNSFHWTWLKSLEKEGGFQRKYFGSPFGVFLPDCLRSFFVVAIRNIQWFQEKTYLVSGCGYISKSEKEKEWEELSWKREAVKSLFYTHDDSIFLKK